MFAVTRLVARLLITVRFVVVAKDKLVIRSKAVTTYLVSIEMLCFKKYNTRVEVN